jgi:deoxyribodipyrimidine photo-lyase
MLEQKLLAIHWFRRDLRLDDNAALYYALRNHQSVLPVFIFDKNILDDLEDKTDARVTFIYRQLQKLKVELQKFGSTLFVYYGEPVTVWKKLIETFHIEAVYTNHDYEPYARHRDNQIQQLLAQAGIPLHTYKDQVIFEKDEVLKDDGTPYTVFTPYSKKWKQKLTAFYLKSYPAENYYQKFVQTEHQNFCTLPAIGFIESHVAVPPLIIDKQLIQNYHNTRDFPALQGTTKLSVHLRFGTISIRKLAQMSLSLNEKYLNELIWREFYQSILWHFPHVVHHAFKAEYDAIPWLNNEKEFELWCVGKTGYPIVDAGMRELNATGFMHNRVRMIVASFLVKDLLIDWRWGEAYFAKKLLDFELASNNGGWQWAAGTGVDAAPYFRIFNPSEQTKKFDPDGIYIKKWVPEITDLNYPLPLVDHAFARNRCLHVYKKALQATGI